MKLIGKKEFNIRNYTKNDYALLNSWWAAAGEVGPDSSMVPPESTFILSINSTPALAVSVYLTNASIAYVENFIGNPSCKGEERRLASTYLLQYIEQFSRQKGFDRLFCLAHKDKLKTRYQELGFSLTGDAVSAFVRAL